MSGSNDSPMGTHCAWWARNRVLEDLMVEEPERLAKKKRIRSSGIKRVMKILRTKRG